jgi:hypothetical protein
MRAARLSAPATSRSSTYHIEWLATEESAIAARSGPCDQIKLKFEDQMEKINRGKLNLYGESCGGGRSEEASKYFF